MSAGRAVAVAAALAACLTLGGCGLGGRSPTKTTTSDTVSRGPGAAAIARTRVTHELPTPASAGGRGDSVAGGWRTASGAVFAFATTYVNWTAATVATRLRSLSRASLGQARAVTARAAAEVARDRELHEGEVANSGIVESVAPVRGRPHAYAVVTRERTTAADDDAYRGLAPAWHVSVATVTRLSDGLWVLSGWQPEN